MTGANHTKESKNIFRKDAKGGIFKLKEIKRAKVGHRISSSGRGGY